ncbi:MAG: toll/interleukin-1 receptor domain-containing protein [Sphingomonas sp.]|nr:toll/interleukin-1 receptor domain-containing protein [Sphingomonas sp.]
MADIFISYKKEDRKVTEALAAALEAEGLSVWWDNALNPKAAWDSIIEQEIAAARKVLVLWSPRAVKSDWVRSEAHYAQDHGKMVPVKIEECTLPLAFMLRQAVGLV